MRRLALKVAALAALLLGANLALGALVHGPLVGRLDPRRSLFHRLDLSPYRVALLGDSVFGSYYVDREAQALWSRVEALTGRRTLPAGLNAARGSDMVQAAWFLAPRLEPGAVVFVDVTPLKVWLREPGWYEEEFRHYAGFLGEPLSAPQRAWNAAAQPLVSRLLFPEDGPLLATALVGRRHFEKGPYRDRTWDRPPDYARARYRKWLEAFHAGEATRPGDLGMLDEIAGALSRRGHRPVFVLYPLNRALITAFSPAPEAAAVLDHLAERHARTVAWLADRGLPVVDLVDLVPAEGFADLAHTNAAGDEAVARALAAWLAAHPDGPPPRP